MSIVLHQEHKGVIAPEPPGTKIYPKLMQIFHWDGKSLTDAINMCHQYGFTGILVKALDGTNWMNTFDPSPWALNSGTEAQAQADVVHLAELHYYVWTNPLYGDNSYLSLQAARTVEAAKGADGLFLDAEPYHQFWGPNRPVGAADFFVRHIRQGLGEKAFIALQPDPRPARLAELRPEEWMRYCDALAGQHYWSDFQTNALSELTNAWNLGLRWDCPVLPTYPGNASYAGFPQNLAERFAGYVVFRWGTTPPATMSLLGSLQVAGLDPK